MAYGRKYAQRPVDIQNLPAPLSSNDLFTTVPRSQHRFHLIQAIDGCAHLSLINVAFSLGIRDRAPKIHLHLALFLGDDGLNDGRGLLRGEVGLP
jgi:hypothetical protein